MIVSAEVFEYSIKIFICIELHENKFYDTWQIL